MSGLTVSKLADQVGVSADTVRYYERIGLLPEPDRSATGYRLYGDDAVQRLRLIKHAQHFGLRLEEVGELLQIREQGLCPCGHTRTLLERRMADLDEQIAALGSLREDIGRLLADATPADSERQCASGLLQIGTRQPATQLARQGKDHQS
jgi:DNA-binding transcriptional MerR regulator